MSEEQNRGAVVEIIDPADTKGRGPLVPTRVRINGVDVGYTQGVTIGTGGKGEPTRVTVVLVPSQVIIRGGEA